MSSYLFVIIHIFSTELNKIYSACHDLKQIYSTCHDLKQIYTKTIPFVFGLYLSDKTNTVPSIYIEIKKRKIL